MKLVMIDNYDSFTFNIVQYFGELGAEVEVFRNDEITVAEIEARLNEGGNIKLARAFAAWLNERLVPSAAAIRPARPGHRRGQSVDDSRRSALRL